MTHKMFAADMLIYSVLGPHSHCHPEWESFIAGFQLPCSNGFRFTDVCYLYIYFNCFLKTSFIQVLQSFEGGPEAFLRQIASSYVSGLGSICDRLLFYDQPAHSQILRQICNATQLLDFTFESLWLGFLNSTGIPCPQCFHEIQQTFSNIIDLTDLAVMDTPAFRSRMFVWAATGSPLLQGGPVGEPISVSVHYFPF